MTMKAIKHSIGSVARMTTIAAVSALVGLPVLAESMPGSMPSSSMPSAKDALPTSSTPAKPATAVPAAPTAKDAMPSAKDAMPTVATPEVVTPATESTEPTVSAPANPAIPAPATAATPKTTSGTIVDVAAANQSFKTLVKAVKAAGLTEVLSGEGPYTVFAPTDAAFAALPKGTVEMLLKPENKEKLKKVLTYHVVPGAVESSTLKAGQVETVEGSPVSVMIMDKQVMVNDANVTDADIKASNGVIHVIDKVILPPDV